MLTELTPQIPKAKVALKYCGSCNPYVDLTRIARHLAQIARERGDIELVPLSTAGIEVVVILCGCSRACGNKEEVRARAKHHLVIAGESVAGKPAPEKDIPVALEKELGGILNNRQI